MEIEREKFKQQEQKQNLLQPEINWKPKTA